MAYVDPPADDGEKRLPLPERRAGPALGVLPGENRPVRTILTSPTAGLRGHPSRVDDSRQSGATTTGADQV